jgi:hypothetical protein
VRPGEPVAVTYTWTLAPDARPPAPGYIPFVHLVDRDSVTLLVDDHVPEPPAAEWQPGRTYQFTSLLFVPAVPYVGRVEILMGLYPESGDGERWPLDGVEHRWREYRAGGFELLPRDPELALRFEEGFYPPESFAEAPFAAQRWMRRSGLVTFRRLDKDLVLFLHADTGGAPLDQGTVLRLISEDTEAVATLTVPVRTALRAAVHLPHELLGRDTAVLRLQVTGPTANGAGAEDRGLRLFHLGLARASRLVPAQRAGLVEATLAPQEPPS